MSITDPCEVCDGTGEVCVYSTDYDSDADEAERTLICESCDGSGWGDE